MDFRKIKFEYKGYTDIPETEDFPAMVEYTYEGAEGVKITCRMHDPDDPYPDVAQGITLTAKLNGEVIGTICGFIISLWEIQTNPIGTYIWCDDEDALLAELYKKLLKYAFPMEYVRFSDRFASMQDVARATEISNKLDEFTVMRNQENEELVLNPYSVLITYIFVEEKYRNSGLLSSMLSALKNLYESCGTAICINPLVVEDETTNGRLLAYNDSEEERTRMIKMAEHYGFVHETTEEDTMIAVKRSDYIEEFLCLEDGYFHEIISAIEEARKKELKAIFAANKP